MLTGGSVGAGWDQLERGRSEGGPSDYTYEGAGPKEARQVTLAFGPEARQVTNVHLVQSTSRILSSI